VRIGKPDGVSGLADVVASPAHATAGGLVRYGMAHGGGQVAAARPAGRRAEAAEGDSLFGKIRNILKDFF